MGGTEESVALLGKGEGKTCGEKEYTEEKTLLYNLEKVRSREPTHSGPSAKTKPIVTGIVLKRSLQSRGISVGVLPLIHLHCLSEGRKQSFGVWWGG